MLLTLVALAAIILSAVPAQGQTDPPAAPATPDNYGYYGFKNGIRHAVLTLNGATLGDDDDHAAVWLGLGSAAPGKSWIQGGIEQKYGDTQPYAYIEAGHNGHAIHFERFPVSYGQQVNVTLIPHVGTGHWSVVVDGHNFGSIPITTEAMSMMETYGNANAVGTINGQVVTGKH